MTSYPLDQTFIYTSASHEFQIRWTNIGNRSSPTLIFIHGTPWSSYEWSNLASTLSSRFNIYLYDHPGFEKSPSPRRLLHLDQATDDKIDLDGPLTLRAEASAALIKSWNLKSPAHVVAHDNGGLVSLRLLLQHGIEFASLCLVDVVALGPFGLPFFKLVAENHAVFEAIPSHLIEGFVRSYVKAAAFNPLSREVENTLCEQWLAGGSQGPKRFLQEMVQAHNRDSSDVQKEYKSVGRRVPTKIIWGMDDDWLPLEIAGRLKEALNAKELVVVEKAGHLIHFDQPGRLAFEVGLWLTGNSR